MKTAGMAKRILCVLAAAVITVTMYGCSENKEYIEVMNKRFSQLDSFNGKNREDAYGENFFGRRKSSYEFDDAQLNETIDKILDVKYEFKTDELRNTDLNNDIGKQINTMIEENGYYPVRIPDEKVDFDWLVDGKIDKEKFRENLYQNTLYYSEGRERKNNQKSIDCFVGLIEDYIDYIKTNFPDYNLNIFYSKLNVLGFFDSKDKNICASYSGYADEEKIDVYHESCIGENFRKILSHELSHMVLSQSAGDTVTIISGLTVESIGLCLYECQYLSMRFIEESVCERVAYGVNGMSYDDNETQEKEVYNKFCVGVGCTENDLMKVYFSCDHGKLMDLFEPEVQNPVFVLSTTYALNEAHESSLGDGYKNDCYSFGMVNLFRNFCIRNLKEVYSGNIDKAEFDRLADDFIKNAPGVYAEYAKKIPTFTKAADTIKKICDAYASQIK